MVEGYFHAGVPEPVIKSYRTAEQLMAHAWYHYPMYDEALKKLLGIVELAVKERCKELSIPLSTTNRNGRERKKRLVTLMNEVSVAEPTKNLGPNLHHIRKSRNYHAHPERHSYMGGIAKSRIISIVNLINILFLPETSITELNDRMTTLLNTYKAFKDGLFVFEIGQDRYLIKGARPIHTRKIGDEWSTLWLLEPILTNTFKNLSEQRYSLPFIEVINKFELHEGKIIAKDEGEVFDICIEPTDHKANLVTFQKYQHDIDQLSEHDLQFYELWKRSEINKEVQLFDWRCWERMVGRI